MTKFSLSILQSVRNQFSIIIVISVFIILSLFVFVVIKDQRNEIKMDSLREIKATGLIVQGTLNRMFRHNRRAYIHELLSDLSVHPQITQAMLINSSGKILYASDKKSVSDAASQHLSYIENDKVIHAAKTGLSHYQYYEKPHKFIAYVPVNSLQGNVFNNERYILLINYEVSFVWSQVAANRLFELAVICCVILLLGVILWLFLDKKITAPLQILADIIYDIGKGKNVQQIPIYSTNEIGLLARAIEMMSSDRVLYEDEMRKLTQAMEQSSDAIVITDLNAQIVYVNNAFITISGYSKEEILGQNPRILQSGKTPESTYDDMWNTLTRGESWQGELYNIDKQGNEYIESVTFSPIRDNNNKITHYLAIKKDISAQKKAEQQIKQLVYYDSLTSLPNRVKLTDFFHEFMADKVHNDMLGALLLLDLDRFQSINDARDYDFGDSLLLEVVKHLELLIDEGTIVARIGSDTFAVLTPLIYENKKQAIDKVQKFADTIFTCFHRPMLIQDEEVSITLSLGLTIYPEHINTLDNILRHAETALHRAKDHGGDQSVFYEDTFGSAVKERFHLEHELRRAISHDELRLYFQPQVTYHGELDGVEALIRWQHPEKGLVPPGAFIPIAEKSDLIVDIGSWVLIQSLEFMAHSHKQGKPLRVSVNMSPRHFRKASFVPWLKELLQSTGADPSLLTLEITEGLVIDDISAGIVKMTELNNLGICFSIDDFGTGYSSLSYLKRLPVHELKIDRSFVNDVNVDQSNASLVETILSVAQHMHLKVVAEGVETVEQAAFLNARADIIYQGYLYGKPEPMAGWYEQWEAKPNTSAEDAVKIQKK